MSRKKKSNKFSPKNIDSNWKQPLYFKNCTVNRKNSTISMQNSQVKETKRKRKMNTAYSLKRKLKKRWTKQMKN